jgi:hypothetical protein
LCEPVLDEVAFQDGGQSELCETFHFFFCIFRKEISEPSYR